MTSRAESCPPTLVPSNAPLRKPNAALQGASLAFAAHPTHLNPPTKPLSTATGAAAAATAAGNRPFVKNGAATHPIKQDDLNRPHQIKSASHSAAQAASARASPQKDVVSSKTLGERMAMHAHGKSVEAPLRQQTAELEQDRGRGGPTLDTTIAVPRPLRPLPASAALTAILGIEPEISPGSTPHSASPPATTSAISAGLSAARAAAKRATPAAQLSGRSPNAFVDTPGPSVGSVESLSGSKDEVQPALEAEISPPTSSAHSPSMHIGPSGSENVQNAHYSVANEPESAASAAMKHTTSLSDITNTTSGGEPESAASSVMKRTALPNETLQAASKSPPKHAIPTDAMIAWSVASSRAASPANVIAHPTLRRRSKSFGMFHHHPKPPEYESSKPVVPKHSLKHTLRKRHQDDGEEEENEIVKRGRRHLIRKHQHKHHEGDRKRWRDRVTERERKRYEGVWAANRGLFTFWDFSTTAFENLSKPPVEMDAVLNIVVREVWERTRLPRNELEEVWDLVARENANNLRRDEFVVGMWLLDQRLKGRKLPMRVSQSVWASVRHTLKIRAKP